MNTALWVVQILLGLAFLMSGLMKISQPTEKLEKNMKWVHDFPPQIVKLIGVLELLGAVGVVLPALTGTLPWLTPLAALGLVLTMVGAALTHLRRKETPMIILNVVLLLLAAFVVYGRFVAVPL